MDFLKISELYHTQMKGRKHDGVWQFQDKETGNFNDAGFIRYYGHPRGVRGDTPISTALATVNAGPGVMLDMDGLFTGGSIPKGKPVEVFDRSEDTGSSKSSSSKEKSESKEETNYAKMLAEEKARGEYERTINPTNADKMRDQINDWKTQEEYSRYRKMYAPTNEEQFVSGLQSLASVSSQLGNVIPKDEGKKIYGNYPKLTTEELNERINRISRERTYSDLVGDTQVIKSGKSKLREGLQTFGAAAGIFATIAGAVVLLKKKTS